MRRKSYRARLEREAAPTSPLTPARPASPVTGPGIELSPGVVLPLRYANRHGLITGQTGTGKSVTLLRMAEGFAAAGSAVFLADVKGDLSRLAATAPVRFLDAFGTAGDPFKVGPADMGADLFARALDLSDAQAGTLELAFHLAGIEGVSLDSGEALSRYLGDMLTRRDAIGATHGQVSASSVGVIRRALLRLDPAVTQAPSFDVAGLLGAGRINLLRAEKLWHSPRLYAALLMYCLVQLDRRLPEIGDCAVPRLVFFFDEAHLLFSDVPPALLQQIERTVRLIRSKGVGVYFASQMPDDIPGNVREQLAHRIAHSRAYGVGRATVETLDGAGGPWATPRPVSITPPACLTAPVQPPVARPVSPDAAPMPRPSPQTGHHGPSWVELACGAAFLAFAFVGVLACIGIPVAWSLPALVGLCVAPLLRFPRRGRRSP